MEVSKAPGDSKPSDFGKRMEAVFGSLGASSGLCQGWNVSQTAVCKPGRDVGNQDLDEGDEMSHEEEEEGYVEFRKSASRSFCSGLDRECEMDDYDAMATDSYSSAAIRNAEDRPPPTTEVLADSYYEKLCRRKEGRSRGGSPEITDGERFLASEVARCREAEHSGMTPKRGGEPIRWKSSTTDDPEGGLQATHAGSGDRIQWLPLACNKPAVA
eukprot:CAMPEP_0117692520 /NCGR_PEP_ID=MMETSP0804-20121206/26374_1 /TAXON_ID=1074897 /ORGANISM="Tetraselmis astigmatica, Strain CCMP880" /LENGTH=213 /DNA_ID=CAMNT_0005505979 /DNA_START=209 /DNA_END=846 /DNA_ORIENTATION=-